MGIPGRLRDALPNVTKEQYEAQCEDMAYAALEDSCTDTNPRVPSKPELVELFKKLW
jgi:alcohol dehydrogenase class IV